MKTIYEDGKIADWVKDTPGIYVWTNKLNGRQYVGQTFDLRRRTNEHLNMVTKHTFGNALRKYGIANFTCYKVMDCCPSSVALDYWESYWIRELNTFHNGYNETTGGSNGLHSEETKRKMSIAHSGERNHFYGKEHSIEARRKMSIAKQNMSVETRRKLSIAMKEALSSIETRRKLSIAQTGKKRSIETKEKIRKANYLRHGTLYKQFFEFSDS